MRLNELFNDRNKKKVSKTLGRGHGSGLGKTSGKGHKGQKARSGHHLKMFSGGQTSIMRRLPKRGDSRYRLQYKVRPIIVNLAMLQSAIDLGKLNTDKMIVFDDMVAAGYISPKNVKSRNCFGTRCRLVLLGDGVLTSKIRVQVNRVSEGARKKIEELGGEVSIA